MHEAMTSAGALSAVLPLVNLLSAESDEDVGLGVKAASFLCLLSGHSEAVADAIHANPVMVTKMGWLLSQVIEAGPGGVVIGGRWDPALIAEDLATLATFESNRPLLATVVPVLVKGMRLYSFHVPLIERTISILYLVSSDETCASELAKVRDDLLAMRIALSSSNVAEKGKLQFTTVLDRLNKLGSRLI